MLSGPGNNTSPLDFARTQELKDFYQKVYVRSTGIAGIPQDNDFMYAQVLGQIRPYLRPGLKVLDLGCNNGNVSLYMARAGCDVTGIDLAQNAVEAAQKSASYYGIGNARFQCLDFLSEWKEHSAFDFVFCCNVIEHVPNDRSFLEKIAWALKPGGNVYLSTACSRSSLYRINLLLHQRFEFDEEVGHLRRYTEQSLSALCSDVGLEIEKVIYLDSILREWFIILPPLRRFNRIWGQRYLRSLFNRFDLYLARYLFPGILVIHAKKG